MRRYPSTFLKLFVDIFLVVAVVIILTGAFTHWQLNAKYQQESQQGQDRLAHLAAEHFQELWPLDRERVDQVCKKLLHDPDERLTVIAQDGRVLGDSDADPLQMVNHKTADRPEVLEALGGRTGSDTRRSETLHVPYRYVALPLMWDGNVAAAVRLAVPVKAIAEGESYTRNAVLWSMAVGAGAAILLGLLTAWIWYAPLRRITRTAQRLASGEVPSQAETGPSGRLGDLAAALNEMRDSLGQHLGRIASQHQDFQIVLAHLEEGVVATDADGKVAVMNPAAGQLLGADPAKAIGRQLAEVLPSLEILDLDEQALAGGTPLRRQFDIDTPHGKRRLDVRAMRVAPGASSIRCLLVIGEASP
jgi:two-component system, OmpR family, phosphate regulon sensor histidine kinase PhoR